MTYAHFMMHKSFEEIKMFDLKLYPPKNSDCSSLQRMGERLLERKHLLEEFDVIILYFFLSPGT